MVNQDDDYGQFSFGGDPNNGTLPVALPPPVNGTGIPINGNNRAGYMDLSYWQSRGITPDQIFDENGQPRPGWARTGNGYEQTGAQVPAPTGATPQPTPYNYGGDYHLPGDPGSGGGSGQFDYGRPLTNTFTPYHPLNYPQFSFGAFTPTNRDDLYNEQLNPGFTRGQERLKKQIEGGAAYQGMLRSGMTFDRLGSILGNNEEQQFTSFDNRRARDYGINRDNMAGAWTMNQGMAERDNTASNNFRFNTEDSTQKDILSRWAQLVSSATQLSMPRG